MFILYKKLCFYLFWYFQLELSNREAAAQYPWSTAEKIMRHVRKLSVPELPNNLHQLAHLFENGQLNRFHCNNIQFFQSCVPDGNGNDHIIFACPQLITAVIDSDVHELHADATFKVVPSGINAKQLLVLHCMVQNYVNNHKTKIYSILIIKFY